MNRSNKTTGGLNNTFMKRPRLAQQDLPYSGTASENDEAVLADGKMSINTDRKSIHIHDGIRQGGYEIPNLVTIIGLLGAGPILGTLAELLELEPTLGLVGVATDTSGLLVGAAEAWSGNLGVFASEAALAAVPVTNLAAGTTASVLDLGFAQLSSTKTKWLFAFVAELPDQPE